MIAELRVDAEQVDAAVSGIAAAIGEPARARMLYCLMDGHARTATELAILAGVLATCAGGTAARATDCIGTLAPGSYDSLNVPAGAVCNIKSGTVTVAGHVTVGAGADLILLNSTAQFTVNGSLLAVDAHQIDTRTAPTGAVNILGSMSVRGITRMFIGNTFINGALSVTNSNNLIGDIEVTNNNVAGGVLVSNNTAGFTIVISGNMIGGSLVCSGNSPGVIDGGFPNTVGGAKVGQCSSL